MKSSVSDIIDNTTTNTAAQDEPLAVLPPVDDDAAGREAVRESLLDEAEGADIVILSKFGKQEAARGGLSDAFRAAIAAELQLPRTAGSIAC